MYRCEKCGQRHWRGLLWLVFTILIMGCAVAHLYKQANSNIRSICIYYHKDNPHFQEKGGERPDVPMHFLSR